LTKLFGHKKNFYQFDIIMLVVLLESLFDYSVCYA